MLNPSLSVLFGNCCDDLSEKKYFSEFIDGKLLEIYDNALVARERNGGDNDKTGASEVDKVKNPDNETSGNGDAFERTDEKPSGDGEASDEKPSGDEVASDEKPSGDGEASDEKPSGDEVASDEKPSSDGEASDEKPSGDGDPSEKADGETA
jgi:hypothetical protein